MLKCLGMIGKSWPESDQTFNISLTPINMVKNKLLQL